MAKRGKNRREEIETVTAVLVGGLFDGQVVHFEKGCIPSTWDMNSFTHEVETYHLVSSHRSNKDGILRFFSEFIAPTKYEGIGS